MRAWTEARATPCSTCRCGVGAAVEGPENVAPPVARGFQTASTQMAESGRKPGLDLAAGRLMTSTGLPQGSSGEEGQQ